MLPGGKSEGKELVGKEKGEMDGQSKGERGSRVRGGEWRLEVVVVVNEEIKKWVRKKSCVKRT